MLSISIRSARTLPAGDPAYAVGFAFLTLSTVFGSWLARLHEVQTYLGLSDASLGLALLGASAGSLLIVPLANRSIAKLSSGPSTTLFALLFCLSMVLPALAGNGFWLFGALLVIGMGNGAMNISMNAAASAVERHSSKHIMSTCHGLYSLGIVLGSGSAGAIAAMGVPLPLHLAGLGVLFGVLHVVFYPLMSRVPLEARTEKPGFRLPPRHIWGLAAVGFCVMIAEGAVADWSSVYMRRELGSSLMLAGWGYASFAATMAIGRFFGDRIRSRFSATRLLATGGMAGGTGLMLSVFSTSPLLALVGFGFAGAGYALLVPVLYSEAARMHTANPSAGISAVATAGITGFLLGPPIIGWLAALWGLGAGLGFAAILTLLGVVLTVSGVSGGKR